MARLIKGDYETPIGKPTSDTLRIEGRQKSVESGIRHTRSRVGRVRKGPGVDAKLESMRIDILKKINEIFSKWGVNQRKVENIIGKSDFGGNLNWTDIRGLVDHIHPRWKRIYSRVPDGKHLLKELMEEDVDAKDADHACIEVAQFFGFRDYDELTSYIELGEKSEKEGL